MKIRDAQKEEIPYIRQQRIEAYSEHTSKIPANHWQGLKEVLSSEGDLQPGVELMVAESDGKILGSVALYPPDMDAYEGQVDILDYPEIRLLAVAPEARGKGTASALIQECIDRAKTKGYHAIGLHTADFMENALKLYQRFGFERMPQHDFEPANDGIIVKAFRLPLT